MLFYILVNYLLNTIFYFHINTHTLSLSLDSLFRKFKIINYIKFKIYLFERNSFYWKFVQTKYSKINKNIMRLYTTFVMQNTTSFICGYKRNARTKHSRLEVYNIYYHRIFLPCTNRGEKFVW